MNKQEEKLIKLAQLTENEADFYLAMNDKYLKKAYENNRSLVPWETHDLHFLMERLYEEMMELLDAYKNDDIDGIKDECLDVANFARFIYHKMAVIRGRMKKRKYIKYIRKCADCPNFYSMTHVGDVGRCTQLSKKGRWVSNANKEIDEKCKLEVGDEK